ncbi:DDE-type integrase/transposase/recombinase [Histomonas meleagridis]|uniref:DDE-type integrase/transposase/recombinase n=1 Tax=Histomonas meleagridis TaxID=135588 RepID=UPI00355A14F3|nr:DDE-type integrase/transposase/recombinase [Histomonas meleagridis]KAH0802286.1 DDE-type integrase/transposase/recombinase [Histomonas meleagridis]
MHQKRFYAKYVGQLWHTDIHYLSKINNLQYYLIAFIDDCSRYVVHWEVVIDDKTYIASALALIHALGKSQKPKTITIDNGGEFVGEEFQHVLDEKGIECFRTHPRTPEENGKIERFWSTLEKARAAGRILDIPYIDLIITEYNNAWLHSSLKKQFHFPLTPLNAWNTMEHYNGQIDADIVYIE